ncbi:MAG: hypothetical protein E7641_05175 [Ruminococcaceae bacterium]|nr:hypothetical protein [Oscillospiraceae bacterium]
MRLHDEKRFSEICDKFFTDAHETTNLGTYNEKRLHLILKRFACDDPDLYEARVGKYVADIAEGDTLTEIQTGGLYPLREKLRYYLTETEYKVRVVHPVIYSKQILRVDKDSGELIRSRKSPKRLKQWEIMQEIYRIGDFVANKRLELYILYITADEYRYSDEIFRYRKKGRYESELFPRTLIKTFRLCGAEDYRFLLDGMPNIFTAKEYGAEKGVSGRSLYATLNLLVKLGFLTRRKANSRSFEYAKV